MSTWKERLRQLLIKSYGQTKGSILAKKYSPAFSDNYQTEYPPEIGVADIAHLEQLSDAHPIEVKLYYTEDREIRCFHLRLFQWKKAIPLSDILPMLENLGLRTESERPHRLRLSEDQTVWMSDFIVTYAKGTLVLADVENLFEEAFIKIYFGLAENDGFNKLVLAACLSWREVVILRTYAKYLRQVGFRFTQTYIEKALYNHADIAKNLVTLFISLHNPALKNRNVLNIEKNILETLDAVTSLDEDKIMRRLLALIKATLRTNYFQKNKDKQFKEYLAFKFNSHAIPELPLPVPLYEIFIYSPRFEGIHLRNAKVARGGIRWSDRPEDFRTEILGLMKAQTVKNAVIVPSGAKGGFVLKNDALLATKEMKQAEVIHCYKAFISGLLDLTDNIKNKKCVPPKEVVCYDEPDPYLVVAADKGTATFSDIANSISLEYQFWLDDAFASGGKTGYDHKKMGITARGAWESIKRHFRELDIDPMHQDISVVGIGDMSGDVFGNGMLYSKHICLVAAFDHRHIFIDPTPDPKVSYYERLRLFNLPASSWEDYNAKLISKGGGVYKRSLKSIAITAPMRKALGIEATELAPNDLISAILKAPVDLLFNGGIGTYVKASHQSNADVGDRANDYCRVNGEDLRCSVVGEGGNLGFTQLGRVEYALNMGLINTDFIDNSAGVDCSDHEVNLKILLDNEVHKGQLTLNKRNQLLASLTDEVAALVLNDNYQQALVMSFSSYHSPKNIGLHIAYLKELENQHIVNREVEYLPDDKQLVERRNMGIGLTRPELAILLAYSKIHIKHKILASALPEDPYLSRQIATAFPPSIYKKYASVMYDHRLHRDIIATQLSNQVVNAMGMTFIYRLQMETGATTEEILRAYSVAANVFATKSLQLLIESLDFKIPLHDQYDMMYNIRNLVNLATRWFLRNLSPNADLEKVIHHYAERVKKLENLIPDLMSGATKEYLASLTERFVQLGLAKEIAQQIATYRAIYTSLNIIEVATKNNFDLIKTAEVYFAGGERINLVWFRDQIATDSREGHWNTLARLTLRDELDVSQRALTVAIMRHSKRPMDAKTLIDSWAQQNERVLNRWERLLGMLHTSTSIEYTMFFIAIRELLGLIYATQRSD